MDVLSYCNSGNKPADGSFDSFSDYLECDNIPEETYADADNCHGNQILPTEDAGTLQANFKCPLG